MARTIVGMAMVSVCRAGLFVPKFNEGEYLLFEQKGIGIDTPKTRTPRRAALLRHQMAMARTCRGERESKETKKTTPNGHELTNRGGLRSVQTGRTIVNCSVSGFFRVRMVTREKTQISFVLSLQPCNHQGRFWDARARTMGATFCRDRKPKF